MKSFALAASLLLTAAPVGAQEPVPGPGPSAPSPPSEPAATAETAPAEATPPPAEASGNQMTLLAIAARAGALFGQPFSTLGSSVIGEIGASVHPSVWQRRLGFYLGLGYSQPSTSETVTDPRLTQNMGKETYTTTVRDLGLTGALGLWFPVGERLLPYATAGAKMHLYRYDVVGSAGAMAPFGENREPKTRVGFVGRAGLGFGLGPGFLTGDLTFDAAPVRETVTGKANAGDLVISFGYLLRV